MLERKDSERGRAREEQGVRRSWSVGREGASEKQGARELTSRQASKQVEVEEKGSVTGRVGKRS